MKHVPIFFICLFLAACGGSPEEEANAEVVRINQELTQVILSADLEVQLDKLEQLQREFEALPNKYPQASVSVRILSREEVAGLSFEKFERKIEAIRVEIQGSQYDEFTLTLLGPMVHLIRRDIQENQAMNIDVEIRRDYARCLIANTDIQTEQFLKLYRSFSQSVHEEQLADEFLTPVVFESSFQRKHLFLIRMLEKNERLTREKFEKYAIPNRCSLILDRALP